MQSARPQSDNARMLAVITPENTVVTYQLAGLVTRTAALLIDLLIQALLIVLLTIINSSFQNVGFGLDHLVSFLGFIAAFCVMFVYSIFFEMVWGGRTPGKRLLGLRVVRDGGYPINITSSCIRNILKFADLGVLIMPSGSSTMFMGLPGLLSVFLSPQYKRIGDYAAGTVVIHDQILAQELSPESRKPGPLAEHLIPTIRNIDRLSHRDYQAIRRLLARRNRLEPAVAASTAQFVAEPIMEKLGIQFTPAFQMQYMEVLEAIEQRYAEEYGIL
jgi:uncharacterized RDD family membrane protein YckC